MNHRQRFDAIMSGRPFDRVPVYYFGYWEETLERWLSEGLPSRQELCATTGLDPDWEENMWMGQGIRNLHPICDRPDQVIEENDSERLVRTGLGALIKISKTHSSIPQDVEYALAPTREAWAEWKKYLNADDPRRWLPGWEEQVGRLAGRDHVVTFLAGSLFGYLRNWMGVEHLTMLAFTDPLLFEQIIDELTEFYIAVNRPLLEKVDFDFAYIWEDCCFNTGPLLSPSMYTQFFQKYYRRLCEALRSMGVRHIMLDSDGKVDVMIPLWLDSGIDIIFPIEVGTWKANPVALRRQFGPSLKMMGGVDKLVIPHGEQAIRAELEPLAELTQEGGFIPLPDHRIHPACSLEDFKTYVRVFKDVFNVS